MERYKITYHPLVVKKDIPRLGNIALMTKEAIYKKLTIRPEIYGRRLRGILKGYWKLRVEDWRVVYEIYTKEVRVQGIAHRKDIYDMIKKRFGLV